MRLLKFLKREDVHDVIGKNHHSNKDDSFFSDTVTLKRVLNKKVGINQKIFNLYDAVFFATLIIVYNDPLFKKLRGKKNNVS